MSYFDQEGMHRSRPMPTLSPSRKNKNFEMPAKNGWGWMLKLWKNQNDAHCLENGYKAEPMQHATGTTSSF